MAKKYCVKGCQPLNAPPTTDIIAHRIARNFCAVHCPIPDCKEEFPLERRGDLTTYNVARYHIHLLQTHNIFLPKPIPVEDK